MPDTSEYIANRLMEESKTVINFFDGQPADFWQRQIYTEGAHWTGQQILAHLIESEASMNRLVDNIRGGGAGTPEDFDLNSYNERHVDRLQGVPPAELLARFTAQRQQTADRVRAMSADDLAKTGRHPFLGVATVADIFKMIYRHNQIHVREIRKVTDY